jgi:hypothetical protein
MFARALKPTIWGAFALLLLSGAGEAETLYQSVPDLSGPIYPGGICSSCNGVFRVFDTFVLASSATVDAVALSVYNVPFPVSINVSVWSIGNNLPNAELFSETFAPSDFSSTTAYSDRTIVTLDPTGLSLSSGTYYISFYNQDELGLVTYYSGSGVVYQQGNGFAPGQYEGFVLSGQAATAPIPSSLLLFGSGLLSLGFFGWHSLRQPKDALTFTPRKRASNAHRQRCCS